MTSKQHTKNSQPKTDQDYSNWTWFNGVRDQFDKIAVVVREDGKGIELAQKGYARHKGAKVGYGMSRNLYDFEAIEALVHKLASLVGLRVVEADGSEEE